MSWLFITRLNFSTRHLWCQLPRDCSCFFSLIGAGALNHWVAPNEPLLWRGEKNKPADLHFNENPGRAKKCRSEPWYYNTSSAYMWFMPADLKSKLCSRECIFKQCVSYFTNFVSVNLTFSLQSLRAVFIFFLILEDLHSSDRLLTNALISFEAIIWNCSHQSIKFMSLIRQALFHKIQSCMCVTPFQEAGKLFHWLL